MSFVSRFAVAAATLFTLSSAVSAKDGAILSRWVQLGPGGTSQARIVTTAPTCQKIVIDGESLAMRERAAPDDAFNVRLCSATLPKDAKSALVENFALPLLRGAPSRIVVIGDTGCRIKGSAVQDCNDPAKWPFLRTASEAAKLKPDLVIHVGDYLYREQTCPQGVTGCAGTPWGDKWQTWNADFFTPAAPLLTAAPWVFVRGNHEDCHRAGAGWLRLLGPLSFVAGAPCADHLAPYTVPLEPMTLAIVDDANAQDMYADSGTVPDYANDFASLAKLAHEPLWLVMHRPLWGALTGPLSITIGGNRTMIDALRSHNELAPVALMLSGHIHTFEVLNYADAPPQIIAGNAGTKLDSAPVDLAGASIIGERVTSGLSLPGFGLLLMTRDGPAWDVDEYRDDGSVAQHCRFAKRHVDCGKAKTG